jgi:phage terminase large subunit-like protein
VARPTKSLEELVRDGSFRPGRHHELLAGLDLRWKSLARFQEQYRVADHELERRRIAVQFANAIPQLHARQERTQKSLDETLAKLGPPRSIERVVNYFPWAFRHFAGPRAGKRFHLELFQKLWVQDWYRRDRHGRRVFNVGLLGIPKGNGKTPLAAGFGSLAVLDPPAGQIPDVYGFAGARAQAGHAQTFLKRNTDGELGRFLKVHGSSIAVPERGGAYTLLSSIGDLAHGTNPSAAIGDEIWQFVHRQQKETWNAIAEALHKRPGESWLMAISQAYSDESSLLGEIHLAALKHPKLEVYNDGCLMILRDEASGFLMHWYGAPDDADIEDDRIIKLCNPLSTVSVGDLRAALIRPGADEYDWRRLHLNQPTKGKFSWLPPGAWNRLHADGVQVPAGADIYVGIDAAYSGDTTAVVFAWKAPDGRIHVRARVWSAIAGNPAHVFPPGDSLDNEQLVEPYIHELAKTYKIREIVFDPEYFTNEAKHLARAGFTIAPVYPQSKDMSDAVRAMKKAVDQGKVGHDGDPVLSRHFGNAVGKKVYRGTKEYDAIDKESRSHRIDGATAAVLAHWRALSATPAKPFVLVSRPKKKAAATSAGALPWRS